MPYWRGEQKVYEGEDKRQDDGAEPRDLSEYSTWRETTDQFVLDALEFYGENLIGQTAGMSDALNLGAIVSACDIEGIPQDDRSNLKCLVLMIHSRNMELQASENRKKKR